MKSKTKIERQLSKKKSPNLVETIINSKKNNAWLKIASILSKPRRKKVELNLEEINKISKDGETIVIPGKVLSQGEVHKKVRIVAFNFSKKAMEKLLKSKIQTSTIREEVSKNPEAKGVKIIEK